MRTTRWIAAALTAGLLLGACASDDIGTTPGAESMADSGMDGDFDMGGDEFAAEEPADDMGEAESGGTTSGADGVVTFGGSGSAVTGRQLARTASLILEVEDVQQAATRVTAAAQRAGGFVSGAQVQGGDFGAGSLVLRVPATALDATIQDLAEIGVRVVQSSISTEDLTDQLTDLQARIDNLERLETELQALLSDVRDSDPQATQLLQVFERINQVRGEIERLEAQRAGAQDRVALATINVELLPRSIAPEEVEPEPEGTLAQAWESTKDAFGAIADALIWLVVTILPVTLAILAIPALVIWMLVRTYRARRDRRTAAPPAPPAPPAAPATSRDGSTTEANTPDHDPSDDHAADEDPSNPNATDPA